MKRNSDAMTTLWTAPAPELTLDHLIVFCASPEDAMQPFVDAGYRARPPRVHPGQGTRNQSVQLTDHVFLEFLCVHDVTEAARCALQLDRYRLGSFGIAWRGSAAPVGFWQYDPPYPIPATLWMHPCVPGDVERPLEFVLVAPSVNAEAHVPVDVTIGETMVITFEGAHAAHSVGVEVAKRVLA